MKHGLISYFFLLIFASGFAQTSKFGKITRDEWEITKCSFDSAANNAIILFDIGAISIQSVDGIKTRDPNCRLRNEFFTLIFERQIRIKVSIDDGLSPDFLKLCLRSSHSKEDKLSLFKGILLSRVDDKEFQIRFNIENLKKEIREDGSSIFYLEGLDIKAGSIIDIRYRIETNFFNETPEWNFHNIYPNLYSEIKFSIPNFFLLTKKGDNIKSITYDSFNRSRDCTVFYSLPDGWDFYKYSYLENHEKYSLKNIPSSISFDEVSKLKYLINYIDFNSVSSQRGTFKKLK